MPQFALLIFLNFVLLNRLTIIPSLFNPHVIFLTAVSMFTVLTLAFRTNIAKFRQFYKAPVLVISSLMLIFSVLAVITTYLNGISIRLAIEFVAKNLFFILLFWFTIKLPNQIETLVLPYVRLCTVISILGITVSLLVHLGIVHLLDWRVSLNELVGYDYEGRFGFWRYSFPLRMGLFIPFESISILGFEFHRLSGFSTEPNVFALFLEPSLFFAIYLMKRYPSRSEHRFSCMVIFICLVITMSGATMLILPFLALLWFYRKSGIIRYMIYTTIALALFCIYHNWRVFSDRSELAEYLGEGYFLIRAGTLITSINYVLNAIRTGDFFGAGMRDTGGPLFAILIRNHGIFGFVFYMVIFVLLVKYSLRMLSRASSEKSILALPVLAYSGHMLKAGFYDSFLFFFVIHVFLIALKKEKFNKHVYHV